ncbi:MAG: pilus assembly protein [Geobacter sp.]|nr:pilus assembly protein [Geobacter sulfurreducens]MSM39162.1 pilus assembly protein [Geobacter sp.]
MNLDIFLQKSSNIFAENRLLKFVVVALGIAVVINTAGLFMALNSQRVILVPPVVNSKISVSGDKASDEYLKEFARYILNLALTYNPVNARSQFSELLAVYDPSQFQTARKELYELADKIENTKASSAFYIQSIINDTEKRRLEVTGTKKTYMVDQKAEDTLKVYLIEYRIDNGKFILVRLYEKPAQGESKGA